MRRCLISWDYAATGIWLLPGTPTACQPAIDNLLSAELHEDLKRWNEWACRLFNGQVIEPDMGQVEQWRATELDLANRAQAELGDEWEVLYEDGGAWTWVSGRSPDRS